VTAVALPCHSGFDLLNARLRLPQELPINADFDTASGPRFPSDEACAFERQHHLVNGRG
jgi:hypothetical protein